MPMFQTPFSAKYWKEAAASVVRLRCLVFAALMVAAAIALSYFSIPIHESLKVSFGFLARSVCALVCGPVMAVLYGFVEDILGYILKPTGAFFPGYTLTTMLGCFWYAIFFFRARITITRICLAKLVTNVQNVLLGSLWSAILYSKGYLFYMTSSALKNILCLPVQILMLVTLFSALLPILQRMELIPRQIDEDIPWI